MKYRRAAWKGGFNVADLFGDPGHVAPTLAQIGAGGQQLAHLHHGPGQIAAAQARFDGGHLLGGIEEGLEHVGHGLSAFGSARSAARATAGGGTFSAEAARLGARFCARFFFAPLGPEDLAPAGFGPRGPSLAKGAFAKDRGLPPAAGLPVDLNPPGLPPNFPAGLSPDFAKVFPAGLASALAPGLAKVFTRGAFAFFTERLGRPLALFRRSRRTRSFERLSSRGLNPRPSLARGAGLARAPKPPSLRGFLSPYAPSARGFLSPKPRRLARRGLTFAEPAFGAGLLCLSP